MKTQIFFLLIVMFAVTRGDTSNKIIGGTKAKLGEFPYQISLQIIYPPRNFCGGSIINSYWVITAAHCTFGKTANKIKVVAGTVNLERKGSEHYVAKIIVHENYSKNGSDINDISLIKVKTPFIKSNLISFVPLPGPKDNVKHGDIAIVSGFGLISEFPVKTSQYLYWTKITVTAPEYCSAVWDDDIPHSLVCAHNPNAVRGICYGDSGGPMMVNGKLAGLSKSIRFCGDVENPAVFTRVSAFMDWIRYHTNTEKVN